MGDKKKLGFKTSAASFRSYGSLVPDDDMVIKSQLTIAKEAALLHEERMPRPKKAFATTTLFGENFTFYFLLFYIIFFIIYLVLGAFIFQKLESETEKYTLTTTKAAKAQFLKKHPSVTEAELDKLLKKVVYAASHHISVISEDRNRYETNWSFGGAFFFCITVVTTIGYGQMVPVTTHGKVACIFYGLIGIPITLVLISGLVEKLLRPTTTSLRALNSRLGHLFKPLTIRLMHLVLVLFVLVGCIILVPAMIISYIEEWTFFDSFYYIFISMTTIGLGDFIPGENVLQKQRSLYKICLSFYLIILLTFMMLTMAVFYDIPQLNISLVFATPPQRNEEYESEKIRLSATDYWPRYGIGGIAYTQDARHSVVQIRPHVDDSPSPEETTPVHAAR